MQSMNKDEFVSYLRSGSLDQNFEGEQGGYFMPEYFLRRRRGIAAWVWRLIGNKRGYERVDFQAELIKIMQEEENKQ